MDTTEILLDFKKNRDYKSSAKAIAFTKGAITQLIEFTQSDSYPFPQYSSWLLMHVMENHPDSMYSFHNQLVDAFLSCKEPSTQRNLANVLLKYPYTAYREGELLESFFDLLQDSSTKVALKAYSMYHLVRFLDRYPTLKNEFKSILEEGMRKESAAYIVAANKVLKAIEKIPLI